MAAPAAPANEQAPEHGATMVFNATGRVPEMLRGIVKPGPGVVVPDPAKIVLHRLTLIFYEDEERCSPLEVAFQHRQGSEGRWVFVHSAVRALTHAIPCACLS